MKNQKAGENWQKAGAQEIGSKTRRSPVKSRRMATLTINLHWASMISMPDTNAQHCEKTREKA